MIVKTQQGLTLIELMIVAVIVAVLLTVALPSYQKQVQKTQRSLAKAELLEVMARQEQFFLDHRRYAAVLTELGYPTSPYSIDADSNDQPATAPQRVYLIEISTQSNSFTLYAIPQLSQSGDILCGTLSLTSIGFRSVTGSGSLSDCW